MAASLHASVQVEPAEVRYWTVQAAMPEPASTAVPLSVTLPASEAPGLVSVAIDGAVLSTRTVAIALVVLKPALSVAMARAS